MAVSARCDPTLEVERALFNRGYRLLGGVDEVGRGAISGPATVGIVLIDATVVDAPVGVRDSKVLSASRRRELCPTIRRWALDSAVGHASASTVDEVGINAALALAGRRALAALRWQPDVLLLDGSYNWLSGTAAWPTVVTRVGADVTCASVSAASVLAKVERDHMMIEFAEQYPLYGWDRNKGYATAMHLGAIEQFGPCVQHRRSWNLPKQQQFSANGS